MIFSQTLTLYVTPVFYLYIEKLRRKPKVEEPPRRGELEEIYEPASEAVNA